MRRRMLFVAATMGVGAALALPSAAWAQAVGQDSVMLTGGPANVADASGSQTTVSTLSATSGPSGENPSGSVAFTINNLSVFGQVTCLGVSGNIATINFGDQGTLFGHILTVQVVDDAPDTFDYGPLDRDPSDCTPFTPMGGGGPLTSGDITVQDAQPFPTSTEQCKNGGWRSFLGFKNQGECVSFVATGGTNPPAAGP